MLARDPGSKAGSAPSLGVSGVFEHGHRARPATAPAPAPWRSTSRRTRRSWAAGDRAGRCRLRCHGGPPQRRCARRCRARAGRVPAPSRPAPESVRPPWFSNPARTRRRPGSSSTSMATLPIRRGPSPRTVIRSTQADPGQRLVAELIGMPEQLIAAADAEDHGAARGGRMQVIALGIGKVARAQLLIAVLTPTHVDRGRRRQGPAARPGRPAVRMNPSPRQRQRCSSRRRLPRSA